MPPKQLDRLGLVNYLGFLLLFLLVTIDRTSSVYHFGQASKMLVSIDDFMRVQSMDEYYEWLGYHFFPTMSELSYARGDSAAVSLVGIPRIRQVRATPCEADERPPEDVQAMGQACWSSSTISSAPFGRGGKFTHSPEDITGDAPLKSPMGGGAVYGGGGHLLPDHTVRYYMRVADDADDDAGVTHPAGNHSSGSWAPGSGGDDGGSPRSIDAAPTELYPFVHASLDLSQLQEDGWADGQTLAIFHDLTLVVAGEQMYRRGHMRTPWPERVKCLGLALPAWSCWLCMTSDCGERSLARPLSRHATVRWGGGPIFFLSFFWSRVEMYYQS